MDSPKFDLCFLDQGKFKGDNGEIVEVKQDESSALITLTDRTEISCPHNHYLGEYYYFLTNENTAFYLKIISNTCFELSSGLFLGQNSKLFSKID